MADILVAASRTGVTPGRAYTREADRETLLTTTLGPRGNIRTAKCPSNKLTNELYYIQMN